MCWGAGIPGITWSTAYHYIWYMSHHGHSHMAKFGRQKKSCGEKLRIEFWDNTKILFFLAYCDLFSKYLQKKNASMCSYRSLEHIDGEILGPLALLWWVIWVVTSGATMWSAWGVVYLSVQCTPWCCEIWLWRLLVWICQFPVVLFH